MLCYPVSALYPLIGCNLLGMQKSPIGFSLQGICEMGSAQNSSRSRKPHGAAINSSASPCTCSTSTVAAWSSRKMSICVSCGTAQTSTEVWTTSHCSQPKIATSLAQMKRCRMRSNRIIAMLTRWSTVGVARITAQFLRHWITKSPESRPCRYLLTHHCWSMTLLWCLTQKHPCMLKAWCDRSTKWTSLPRLHSRETSSSSKALSTLHLKIRPIQTRPHIQLTTQG